MGYAGRNSVKRSWAGGWKACKSATVTLSQFLSSDFVVSRGCSTAACGIQNFAGACWNFQAHSAFCVCGFSVTPT